MTLLNDLPEVEHVAQTSAVTIVSELGESGLVASEHSSGGRGREPITKSGNARLRST